MLNDLIKKNGNEHQLYSQTPQKSKVFLLVGCELPTLGQGLGKTHKCWSNIDNLLVLSTCPTVLEELSLRIYPSSYYLWQLVNAHGACLYCFEQVVATSPATSRELQFSQYSLLLSADFFVRAD